MIKKILIANRGEIAVRIIRTCREMGIETVAIYSEADRLSLHTRMADEAYFIGPPPVIESYLRQEKIIEVAKKAGAEAIHPGYGFLAENADFADRVEEGGLIFIGPTGRTIRSMGDKTQARHTMQAAGVPIIPGTMVGIRDIEECRLEAAKIGYPVLIKASAGGGGKGMRIVYVEKELASAMRGAQGEAKSAFGNPEIYLEKYLEHPRHIEFQILADQYGNLIHLGERECSIQRRHQKLIEESPSTLLDDDLRGKMAQTALSVARACSYHNAGTIEFLLDQNRNFYFLEVNARLQVEHPVTEWVTGLDLVGEQLRIASGEPLALTQEEVKRNGHAIESRIYAEDVGEGFMPSIGTIRHLNVPGGYGVREDSALYKGCEITIYYDPLIAKLITWGRDRSEAIERMKRALGEYEIGGVETTIPFCQFVMNNPRFVTGEFDTHFVEEEFNGQSVGIAGEDLKETAVLGAILFQEWEKSKTIGLVQGNQRGKENRWKTQGIMQGLR
ncbi:acetyl-CoA carboxylase biotin carboxylase subunit [candidate division KSB1 bacterium]|nr:acetyl-CoA carboxylase biotin carboxylase subunit [candidate division KSB1 bacterium]